MDANTFRETAHKAIEDIITHLTTFRSRRVTPTIKPGYLKPLLPSDAPAKPESPDAILNDIDQKIKTGLTDWQHPNFFAFFPAGVTFPSILGELYSAAFNAPAFNWLCSPACTELETVMLDWVGRMLALPSCFLSDGPTNGGGVLQGSASEAVVVAMVAARERYIRRVLLREGLLPEAEGDSEARILEREDRAAEVRGRLVALGSEHAHSATHKGANVLGLRYRTVPAPASTGFRVTGANLRKRIQELREQGLEPAYLTVCLGTTGTCAVDDFAGVVEVMKEVPEMWVHVDAAYAGAALICPEHRSPDITPYLSHFDSFDVNMHKWLAVNFDASCMFVRSRADLTQGLTITPSYLQNPSTLSGTVTDYRDWQIPLGRRFRSLKIWWVLRSYGVSGLQGLVREHVRLGEVFAGLCRGEEGKKAGIEVVTGPTFALTVVRVVPRPGESGGRGEEGGVVVNGEGVNGEGANGAQGVDGTQDITGGKISTNPDSEMNAFGENAPSHTQVSTVNTQSNEAANAFTKAVYERINAEGEYFLTSAVLGGIYAIRVVGAGPNTDERAVRGVFGKIVEVAGMVRGEGGW